jgi:hypothetical protein
VQKRVYAAIVWICLSQYQGKGQARSERNYYCDRKLRDTPPTNNVRVNVVEILHLKLTCTAITFSFGWEYQLLGLRGSKLLDFA